LIPSTIPSLALAGTPWAYLWTGLLALAGLTIFLIALAAGRARGHRRCPRCWYDMSGATAAFPLRCPECGREILTARELARTRRRWRLASLGVLLAAPLLAQIGWFHGLDIYYGLMPRWKHAETVTLGSTIATRWTIRDPRERGQRAVVRSGSRTILSIEGADITFGQRDWALPPQSTAHKLGAGDDLNGDGTPELVVFAYSGGAHCCYTVSILELSEPPLLIATIDAQNGMGIKPATADPLRRGQYDLDIPEQSFDYWNAPHAASPMPGIAYRLIDHHLSIDLPEMLRPPPAQATLDTEAARIRQAMAAPRSPLEPDLWRVMLDLIYSGHEPAARAFFDAAWPPTRDGKEAFYASFRSVLDKSLHYRNFKTAFEARSRSAAVPPPPAALPAPAAPR
jgi:hypothetical protein